MLEWIFHVNTSKSSVFSFPPPPNFYLFFIIHVFYIILIEKATYL